MTVRKNIGQALGMAFGVGAAMAVALQDIAVGVGIGAAIFIAMTTIDNCFGKSRDQD